MGSAINGLIIQFASLPKTCCQSTMSLSIMPSRSVLRTDLAEKHCHAVLASANCISIDSIRCVNDTQFRIELQSNLRRFYLVDIQRQICNCLDFPRLWFCKHLCAVKIQYPFIPPFEKSSPDLPRLSPCYETTRGLLLYGYDSR